MGLFGSIVGSSKVKSANKKLNLAREATDKVQAETLLSEAMTAYATVAADSSAFTGALYGWGAALLHSARLKDGGAEAKGLYEEAGKKFSYCLVAKADYLAAALDWGVALMELTPFQEESERAATYALAKEKFTLADSIQEGVASYNFACLHAVSGDFEACKASLEAAHDYKNLPDEAEILSDVDMQSVKNEAWFTDFITSLSAEPEVEVVEVESDEKVPEAEYSKVKLRDDGSPADYEPNKTK